MDWVLPFTSSDAFNFAFTFTIYPWMSLTGILIIAKVLTKIR